MNDWISEINVWLYGIVSGLIAGIIWLLRKVNTNEAQIELLKKEIELRTEAAKDSEAEIKAHLSEMRSDIKSLMSK